MISLEKWNILTPLQKVPNNEGHLVKIIVATGFKKLPKVQQIAQSGHTSDKVVVTAKRSNIWSRTFQMISNNWFCLMKGSIVACLFGPIRRFDRQIGRIFFAQKCTKEGVEFPGLGGLKS